MIPFSPPRVDQKTIDAVTEVLKSGWITTGPKTKLFEQKLAGYCGCPAVHCVNSATAGLELMLRWFGVGEGDEVIVPAYTYCATANVVVHCGAKPVMVDTKADDFTIDTKAIEKAITPRTKVIIPVDFAGLPCDYDEIGEIVRKKSKQFSPANDIQERLGRMLLLSDSAHSFGASYKGKKIGSVSDIAVFSFHAVKNLTAAEGGGIALNLPDPFDNRALYKQLCVKSLHGQSKDALTKTNKKGEWRYDVVEAGFKCNMTDLQSAIGLVELDRYGNDTLVRRKAILDRYSAAFRKHKWAQVPVYETNDKKSSYHLYPLRIYGITDEQRNEIITQIFEKEVSVNVHFIPLPMLSIYKNMGFDIKNFPVTQDNFIREISLPVYYNLTDDQVDIVINALVKSVEKVIGNQ